VNQAGTGPDPVIRRAGTLRVGQVFGRPLCSKSTWSRKSAMLASISPRLRSNPEIVFW
jgi:hypothetical protein